MNPTLGVQEELVRRGHRVSSTATEYFVVPAVEAAGARAVRHTSVFGAYYRSPYTADALEGEGLRCLSEALSLAEQVEPYYREDRPDVLVHDFMAWGARFHAARHGIPTVRLFPTYGVHEKFDIQEAYPLTKATDPKVVEMLVRSSGADRPAAPARPVNGHPGAEGGRRAAGARRRCGECHPFAPA